MCLNECMGVRRVRKRVEGEKNKLFYDIPPRGCASLFLSPRPQAPQFFNVHKKEREPGIQSHMTITKIRKMTGHDN